MVYITAGKWQGKERDCKITTKRAKREWGETD